jgi:hypothetical protein
MWSTDNWQFGSVDHWMKKVVNPYFRIFCHEGQWGLELINLNQILVYCDSAINWRRAWICRKQCVHSLTKNELHTLINTWLWQNWNQQQSHNRTVDNVMFWNVQHWSTWNYLLQILRGSRWCKVFYCCLENWTLHLSSLNHLSLSCCPEPSSFWSTKSLYTNM